MYSDGVMMAVTCRRDLKRSHSPPRNGFASETLEGSNPAYSEQSVVWLNEENHTYIIVSVFRQVMAVTCHHAAKSIIMKEHGLVGAMSKFC